MKYGLTKSVSSGFSYASSWLGKVPAFADHSFEVSFQSDLFRIDNFDMCPDIHFTPVRRRTVMEYAKKSAVLNESFSSGVEIF